MAPNLFKIIFGLIASAFILIVVFRLSSSYMDIGEVSKGINELRGFKKIVNDVYTTGLVSEYEMGSEIKAYIPPNLVSDKGVMEIARIPLILSPAKHFIIKRGEIDVEWWKFYFVIAVPAGGIIFIPLNKTAIVLSTIRGMVEMLPATDKTKGKIYFGIGCNDSDIFISKRWGKEYFSERVLPYFFYNPEFEFNDCLVNDKQLAFIITLSEEAVEFKNKNGILVIPETNETGYVLTKEKRYFYKNPLDILAILLGGERAYNHINSVFFKELKIAANFKEREMNLLQRDIEDEECKKLSDEFLDELDEIRMEESLEEAYKHLAHSTDIYKYMRLKACV